MNKNTYIPKSLDKEEGLKSIKLSENIFNEIMSDNLNHIDYIYLSSNPHLSKEQIQQLFLLKIDNVNINLLRNLNCPEDEIEKFILLKDKIYNIAIAHNPNLKQKYITKLLKFNDKDVTMSLEFSGYL